MNQLGRTMEWLAILAQVWDIEFVKKQTSIIKNAYSKETQESCKYLTEEEKEQILFNV